MATDKTYPNTWDGVCEAARDAGAKWPALVGAQWAVESGLDETVTVMWGLKSASMSDTTDTLIQAAFPSAEGHKGLSTQA